jgi:hypothetical protein
VAAFEVVLKGFETIRSLYQPLLQITDALSDTMKLSGSEAYTAALIFYNNAKNAAKSKVPKAETIDNDLASQFPRGRGKKMTEGRGVILNNR